MPSRLVVPALAALLACTTPRSPEPKAPAAAPAADAKAPVARVDGTTITSGELEEQVRKDVRRLELEHQDRLYELRKGALDQMIVKGLLEAKAKAQGTTVDALLEKEVLGKVGPASEAEVKQVYEQTKASGRPLPPIDQVRGEIARFIRQQRQRQALEAYTDALRGGAKVEVLLPPNRREVAAEGPSKGPEKAPVTIVAFSDFECPYCKRAEATVAEVLRTYGDKVRLVYRDFPLPFHANAHKAAEAAHCAGEQGKYWEMHGKLFASQTLDVESLKARASELKLDRAKFDQCLDSGATAAQVESHKKAGEEVGVTGTPAFFVNGIMINGAQPFEAFKGVIDAELARK